MSQSLFKVQKKPFKSRDDDVMLNCPRSSETEKQEEALVKKTEKQTAKFTTRRYDIHTLGHSAPVGSAIFGAHFSSPEVQFVPRSCCRSYQRRNGFSHNSRELFLRRMIRKSGKRALLDQLSAALTCSEEYSCSRDWNVEHENL